MQGIQLLGSATASTQDEDILSYYYIQVTVHRAADLRLLHL